MLLLEFKVLLDFIINEFRSMKLVFWSKVAEVESDPILTEPAVSLPSTSPLIVPPKIFKVPFPIKILPLIVPELLMVAPLPELLIA